eukprot:UN23635
MKAMNSRAALRLLLHCFQPEKLEKDFNLKNENEIFQTVQTHPVALLAVRYHVPLAVKNIATLMETHRKSFFDVNTQLLDLMIKELIPFDMYLSTNNDGFRGGDPQAYKEKRLSKPERWPHWARNLMIQMCHRLDNWKVLHPRPQRNPPSYNSYPSYPGFPNGPNYPPNYPQHSSIMSARQSPGNTNFGPTPGMHSTNFSNPMPIRTTVPQRPTRTVDDVNPDRISDSSDSENDDDSPENEYQDNKKIISKTPTGRTGRGGQPADRPDSLRSDHWTKIIKNLETRSSITHKTIIDKINHRNQTHQLINPK